MEALEELIGNSQNIHIYTEGSKYEADTEAVFFSDQANNQGSIKVNGYNSVFQAETVGLTQGTKWQVF